MKSLAFTVLLVVLLTGFSIFAQAQVYVPPPAWPDLVERQSTTVFLGAHQLDQKWVDAECARLEARAKLWLQAKLARQTELDPSRVNLRVLPITEQIFGYLGCRLETVGWRQTPPLAKFKATRWSRKITRDSLDTCAEEQARLERELAREGSSILAVIRDEASGNALGPAQCRLITLEAE